MAGAAGVWIVEVSVQKEGEHGPGKSVKGEA
jgi:hypothetical protein